MQDNGTHTTDATTTAQDKRAAAQASLDSAMFRVFLSDLALLEAAVTLRANPDMPQAQRWAVVSAGFSASVKALRAPAGTAVTA